MSKSFMYDLYFGNLVPWERGRSRDPAYTPITRKIGDIKAHLKMKQMAGVKYPLSIPIAA